MPTRDEFRALRRRVDELERMLDALRKAVEKIGGPVDLGDGEEVERLAEELAKLRSEFENHAKETNNRLSVIDGILPTKADKSELLELQNGILDHVRQMIENLLGKFALKEDVSKRFAAMMKKIRELFDLINGMNGPSDDNAMFSKKQGPVSCASCEKNLLNLEAL